MTTPIRNRAVHVARALATAAVAGALIFGTSMAATADESTPLIDLTPAQEAELRAWWTDAAVPSTTQDALLANLERGVLPQSSTGADPVTTLTDNVGGMARTIDVYADGSRRIYSRQTAAQPTKSGVTALGNTISGCTTYQGWRIGCLVKIEDAVSGSSFRIDWYPSSSGRAQVRDMRARTCWNSIGNCSQSGSIKRATQSGTAPAWAEQNFVAWVGPIQAASGGFGVRALGTKLTMFHPF